MPLRIAEGYTGALDFDLLAAGLPDGAASSSDTVELILKTRDGVTISTSGNVSLQSSTSSGGPTLYFGRFLPDDQDLQAKFSPYSARFKVTRATRVVFYPSADADTWTVVKP